MIFVIEDDDIMAGCILKSVQDDKNCLVFSNAIEAMDAITDGKIPELIFLDILLVGPDGFTFLNELISYPDTNRIPVVIVSSLDFTNQDLTIYGVVGVLNKETMIPEDIKKYVWEYAK